MPFLRSLNQFADLYRFTLRHAFSIAVWWPLLAFAGGSGLVLLGLAFYTEPALYAIYNPYLQVVGKFTAWLGISPDLSTHFSHYPAHFRLLAGQFEWAKLPLALTFEGVAIALTARAFARSGLASDSMYTKGHNTEHTTGISLPRIEVKSWLRIVFIWLLIYLLISAVVYTTSNLFGEWLSGSPRRGQIIDLGLFAMSNILIAPLVYSFPLFGVGVDSRRCAPSFRETLRRSVQLFLEYPFISIFILLVPSFLFVYPLTWAVSPSSGFATKLQPELTVYLLGGLIVGNMLVSFLYAGAATRLIIQENR